MAYKTKFLHFKTKASYEAERAKTTEGSKERKVFDAYISFIDEGPTICTWGKEYQCDANSLSLLPQEVTTEKQDQVFKNLGWNVHVISQSDINATTSPDAAEKTKRLEATALLVKETSLIYVRGSDDSSNHYFFKINSSSQLELIRISITTGIMYSINSQFVDAGTIRYDRTQTLSDSNKTLARENIDAANKNDVLPLTIDLNSQTVEDYNTALEAFNSKKPLIIFDSTDPTSRFTANVIEKEATTNDINVYFSFTGIKVNDDNAFNSIGYVGTIKPTGEKTSRISFFAVIQPSNTDPKPLGPLASSGTDNAYSRSDHVHPAQVDITGNAATATTATTATNLATKPILSRNENYIQVTVGNKISDNFTVPYASKTSAAEKLMYGRNILLDGDVTGSTTESFNGSKNVTINTTISTINAEKLTGTIDANRLPEIPIEKIPAAALERLFVVDSQSAAMSIDVQEGDVVQIGSGGPMYFCVSESASTFATKFKEFTAGSATSVPWSGVTGKPTFATVATSGSYNDLTNKPTIPSAYTLPTASSTVLGGVKIGSGISISSGVISATYTSVGAAAASHTHTASQVTGLATVATSGSYNDLTNKPSIPSLSGYATQSWVTSQGYLTSIPAATSSAYGGIQIGYTTSGKNYAVQLSNGKAYVNVPWTDTNTTYSAGNNISISGTTINCTYTLPTASSSVLGGVKVGSNITVSSGTISLSSGNVTSALGYTPAKSSDIPEIPVALPNPYALTINGTSYTGSSAVSINTARILSTSTLSSSTVSAGYSYNNTSSRTISSLSGFSSSNPDSVIISTAKLTFTASNAIKMDGLGDLAGGTYYIYCLSYMANGKIAVNGAVYA